MAIFSMTHRQDKNTLRGMRHASGGATVECPRGTTRTLRRENFPLELCKSLRLRMMGEAGPCILSYLMLAFITVLVCTAKMSKRAPFIVVEGLDRSGKTTQTEQLLARLTESGVQAKLVKFPGAPNALFESPCIDNEQRQDDDNRTND